ncbi:DJ-1/PfpI family protein [Commensalibacter communis]|uniref:DJ-1/PfpI family protein n=1 Tax=Commensalibacter communis TaxID=2972786 RepID=UPI0022FFC109|nr:DJ-1/PfpI family protein [Commensalibacter communis]CAI3946824.1 Transcriptional regulator GlxA [Commensalibacter communis]CAI3947026.1 Transcriptional regulator GlxA [Commensalibacter communis]
MHIAILTFEEYNELDSIIAFGILNRVKKPDWQVSIASNQHYVRSMNGLVVEAHISLTEASKADAVIIGSGMKTRAIANDDRIMRQLQFNSDKQLLASQCSGVLLLSKLGLLKNKKACTDLTTKPWMEEDGITILDQPFYAEGNIATSGGCLSSVYLAAWVIARLENIQAAKNALHYVAPIHEKEEYVERAMKNIMPFI